MVIDIRLKSVLMVIWLHKPVIVPFTPTAENVAAYIFNKLKDKFTDVFKTGLHLQSVKLWETPSSYALYESE